MRWSPLTQSASSTADFACVSEYPSAGSNSRSGAVSMCLPLKISSRRHTFFTGDRPVFGSTNRAMASATSSRTRS